MSTVQALANTAVPNNILRHVQWDKAAPSNAFQVWSKNKTFTKNLDKKFIDLQDKILSARLKKAALSGENSRATVNEFIEWKFLEFFKNF